MRLEERKVFNVYKKKLEKNTYNLGTVEQFVDSIRFAIPYLNKEEFSILMAIPISIGVQDIDIDKEDYDRSWCQALVEI